MDKQSILNLVDNIEQRNKIEHLTSEVLQCYIDMLRLGIKELKTCECD